MKVQYYDMTQQNREYIIGETQNLLDDIPRILDKVHADKNRFRQTKENHDEIILNYMKSRIKQ